MDLTPNDMQTEFVTATSGWLTDNLPLDQARSRPASIWTGMADMGWLNMTAPEMGLDHATEALVFAELGRFLAPVGAISTAVAAKWLGRTGRVALAHGSGAGLRVFDPEGAEMALGVDGAWALPDGLVGEGGIDATAPQCVLSPAPSVTPLPDARAALHLRLLLAAYAVGCADAARDLATDYAKIREQFGRPIGWFQAIKHMCADMAVRAAVARSQLYFAACALDADADDAAYHIAAAKRLADVAALDNGRDCIQAHGGIGMTDEAYPHLTLKRAHLLRLIAPVGNAELLDPQIAMS